MASAQPGQADDTIAPIRPCLFLPDPPGYERRTYVSPSFTTWINDPDSSSYTLTIRPKPPFTTLGGTFLVKKKKSAATTQAAFGDEKKTADGPPEET